MARKWLVLLTIVSVLIFVVAGCAPQPAPPVEKPPEKIVWKHADYVIPSSVAAWGMQWFLGEVERRSEGRFEVGYFWSGSLCPAKEQPEGLKTRLYESGSICPAYHPSKTPLYNIAYQPCIFPFEEDWLTFMSIVNEWHQTPALKGEFAKWNGVPICEVFPAPYTLMGKVRITNLEDLKGKKIRAIGGTAELLKKAGAAIVFTTSPEIYDALSKGVIESAAHNWAHFLPYREYEVSEYWTPGIALGYMPYSLVVNEQAWEELPEDIKKIFQEVKEEFPSALVDHWTVKKAEAVEVFLKAGVEVVEFPAEDNEKLGMMSREIWKEHVDKLEGQGLPGRETFNALQDSIKKYVPGYEPYYLK